MTKLKAFILTLIGSLSMTLTMSAQEAKEADKNSVSTPVIPRRLLFGNPVKAMPKLSPDGTKLAYLAPDKNNVLNVWVKDLKNPESGDRQITAEAKRGVMSYMWQYDPNYIIYSQDKDGDENSHLYQTDIKTLATRDLTPFDGAKAGILDYDSKFPNEMMILLNKRDPAEFDIYRLDLTTGEVKLDTQNPGGVFGWTTDHNLNVRVAESYTKDGDKLIKVRDSRDAPWRDFMTIDQNEIGDGVVDFTPDDKALYMTTSLDGDKSRLLKVDLQTGQKEIVMQDPEYDLDDVMINPKTYELEAVGFDKERYEWVLLDQKLAPDFKFLAEKLKTPFRITSRDLDNQNWIVGSLSDQRPTHFYHYNRQAKTLDFMFSTQPDLEKFKLSEMTPVSYQARDGMKLHGYLSLPVGKEAKNLPLILFVHGGPTMRDSWGLNTTVQWFTNRGYAVLQINYRGSTGYGKQYLNAGNREWGAKMQTDLLDGKQWAIDKGIADPSKIAIYGGSYGGYATLAGLAFTPNEFCCGVDIVGPSNLITLLQTIPPYWKSLKTQMDRRIGDLDKDREFIQSRSPFFKADQIRRPLLIAQGANDPRVKQAESDQIVEAMRKNNLPVQYLLFTDEGHGFARPENRMKFSAAAEAFLARYLGGREELPTEAEDWKSLEK
jgi:dipeptidyl aminopeptidase/acylaminoacyl peptidase